MTFAFPIKQAIAAILLVSVADTCLAQQPKRPAAPIVNPGDGVGGSEYAPRRASGASALAPTFTIKPDIIWGGTGVGAAARPNRPDIIGPGVGVGSIQQPTRNMIIVPGTGVGSAPGGPNIIVLPGTGVGSLQSRPDTIVIPGTGVGSLRSRPDTIVIPGTGVGSLQEQATIIYPGRPADESDGGAGLPIPGQSVGPSGAGASARITQTPSTDAVQVVPQMIEQPATPAALPRSTSTDGVEPLSYGDLDSGLRDCEISFEELKAKSPFCKVPLQGGARCERFSYNQFPEVVLIRVTYPDTSQELCTGTMISMEWALTAAHCFAGVSPAQVLSGAKDKDYVWTPSTGASNFVEASVEAQNAKLLPREQRRRVASQVIVYGKYGGEDSKPQFADDIALVRIAIPFSSQVMQPARIATDKDFSDAVTMAGYGYSNVSGGTLGRFQLTWPKPIRQQAGQLSFSFQDNDEVRSGFCQGDSGGPVFARRVRGCKPYDVVPESRPRLLQGAISYNYLGTPTGNTANERASNACISASEMVMQDLTLPERRTWICRATRNGAAGCAR